MDESQRMRIDKWLWAARFFKARSLAVAAINNHKVKCNGERIKPAHDLKPGDELEIIAGESRFVVLVQGLSAQRRPAPEARLLYAETVESVAARAAQMELRRLAPVPGSNLKGRPTKKEGRLIRGVRGQ